MPKFRHVPSKLRLTKSDYDSDSDSNYDSDYEIIAPLSKKRRSRQIGHNKRLKISKNNNNEIRTFNLKKLALGDSRDISANDIRRALIKQNHENPGNYIKHKLARNVLIDSKGNLRYRFGSKNRKLYKKSKQFKRSKRFKRSKLSKLSKRFKQSTKRLNY